MRKIKNLLILSVITTFIFSSCSMEKRVYLSGYNVEWKNGNKIAHQQELIKNNQLIQIESQNQTAKVINENSLDNSTTNQVTFNDNELIASNDNSILPVSYIKKESRFISYQAVDYKKHSNAENEQQIIKEFKSKKNNVAKESPSGGGKSQLVALLLCIFVGVIGIHRFYLGYIGIGIIQLLTAGGCGIWALIDLIRIITGDLKPKDGDYGKTL